MKVIILSAIVLSLVACSDEQSQVSKAPMIKDVKLASLDIIYASRDTFMQHGAEILDSNIYKMQAVLRAWPETQKSNQQPCYMALRNETARLLNLKDGLQQSPEEAADYKYDCRQSIDYKYDKNRTHDFWKSI